MVVHPAPQGSAFEEATAAFLRTMLDTEGSLLADIADEASPGQTLRYLCESACDLLGADDVAVRLHQDTIGLWGLFESDPGVPGIETVVPQLVADIGTAADARLGQLEFSWADAERTPTPLEEVVAARFATMALLVLERHLARRRQLQALARERQAIAGELHDDPIQVMTAVSLQLQRAATRLPQGDDRAAIQETRALNDNAIERLRHVMFSLHPTTLDEDGLTASIEAYCETFVETEGLRWTVAASDDDEIPVELAALAFRLCRDALVNVMEHAEATTVAIDIASNGGVLRIDVRDDGVGFDLARIRQTRVGHLGIPHAVTLARWAAGGRYTTTSAPGEGTTVTLELPIP